jgi:hypothetical protein
MSGERNFDDYIRKEFSNYSPQVAPHIWDKIVAVREKRKPKFFWLTFFNGKNLIWFAGLLLAISVGAGLIVANRPSNYLSNHTQNTIHDISVSANTKTSFSNKINKVDSAINNSGTNISVVVPLDSHSSKDNSSIAKLPGDNPGNKLSTFKNNKINNDLVLKPSGSLIPKHPLIVSVKGKVHSSVLTPVQSIADNSSFNDNKILENISPTKSISNDKKSALDNNSIGTLMNNYLTTRLSSSVEKISFNKETVQSSLEQKIISRINLPECPTFEKDAAGNKKYLEVYIAPDYALRSITDTANSVYLQKREASTQFTSAFSAGARYTRVFNNGMSLRAAINYSQINEKFSYVQGNIVQVTYTIDPATGDTTGSYTVRGTRYKTTYNHYHSIDIPLTVGYELGNGRFHVNINAGIIANIYSWQKGDVLDTNLVPVSITTGKGSSLYQFKTNMGLGLTGGASFYYKLTDQLHFLAEPYMRYNFQPMSTDKLTLQQKYTTIGLRIGLRFDIPKAGSIIRR